MVRAQVDQAKVLDFMASPKAYDPAPARVDRIATHASVVFLAGDRAYKVKRAVKYPFLDFSTLERRRLACLHELALNRRTAPQLYLDVVPVTRGNDDQFHLGGSGEAVEWVVAMRRFEQSSLLDRMAEDKRLPLTLIQPLARTIAIFHRSADRILTPQESVSALRAVVEDNQRTLVVQEQFVARETLGEVHRLSIGALNSFDSLLRARALGGYVRHCHGDLHLRNIVEIEGEPVLFDAIEFDDAIATIDILYDLAFLLMDLGARGLPGHANALLNAYLDASGDTGDLVGLKLLPLLLCMRAMVRAKVELLRAALAEDSVRAELRGHAQSYVTLARHYLEPRQPRLVAIGGLSGSGKSSVARGLAPHLGTFPGALHVRSDRERKRLFGVAGEDRLPGRAYRAEVSDIVYRICRKRALMGLEGERDVIVDAVHAKAEEREATAACAARAGVNFTGIWLDAQPDAMRARIAGRTAGVSDATTAVLEQQLDYDLGPQSFAVVDANRPVDEVVATCLDILGQAF